MTKETVVKNILTHWTEKPFYDDIREAFNCASLSDKEISNRIAFYINNYIERTDEALEKHQEDDVELVEFLVEAISIKLSV